MPLGVTVTATLPVPFGARVKDAGLIVVVNDPDRSIVNEATLDAI